jgi:hypothetical protein
MSNSFSLATADVLRFNDADGNPVTPPADQVIDPDPVPGSNNFYRNAAFGLDADPGDTSKAAYVACADRSQPGVGRDPRLSRFAPLSGLARRQLRSRHLVRRREQLSELPARRLARDGTLETRSPLARTTRWGLP